MLLLVLLTLAVAMTGWTAVDAARRRRNWLAWAMLVAFTGVIGLSIWLVVRRRTHQSPVPLGAVRTAGILLSAIPLVYLNVAVTLFTMTFVFQVARVDGNAMAPTLVDRDLVIVDKWTYHVTDPRKGDLVMHRYPLNPEKMFVLRVIAEEGDQVRIVKGRVHLNDVVMDDSFVAGEFSSRDDWGPMVVPEGYFFVLADRRNNSMDSRHWGFVPKEYILGKIRLRLWPVPAARSF